jgi:hypothetical protein
MRRLGIRQVRATLYWDVWERDEAYRTWFPAVLHDASRQGMQVLVVVHGTDPRGGTNRDEVLGRFADFVAQRIRSMPWVESWQVWNEIDGTHLTRVFAGLGHRQMGVVYGRHLAEISRRAPGARLVATGLHPDNAPEFWAGVLQHHRPHALTVHVYGADIGAEARRHAPALQRAARGVPLWATEFGAEARLGEGEQRNQWQGFEQASRGLFSRIYGYALTTDEGGGHGHVESHGIIRPNGSRRPAAEWLRTHNASVRSR